MTHKEATDRELYSKLTKFYPVVEPDIQFVTNLFSEFKKDKNCIAVRQGWRSGDWNDHFSKWLPEKAGLLRNPDDPDKLYKFIVVDPKLYAFALLRYS